MEFLTQEELIEVTGYLQRSKQIEQLKIQHYPIQNYDRFGKPLVLYKDVFGFRRNENGSSKPTYTQWQPPPRRS